MCTEISFLVCTKTDENGNKLFHLVHDHNLDSHHPLYALAKEQGYDQADTGVFIREVEIDCTQLDPKDVDCNFFSYYVRRNLRVLGDDLVREEIARWLTETYKTPQGVCDAIIEEERQAGYYSAIGFHSKIRKHARDIIASATYQIYLDAGFRTTTETTARYLYEVVRKVATLPDLVSFLERLDFNELSLAKIMIEYFPEDPDNPTNINFIANNEANTYCAQVRRVINEYAEKHYRGSI